MSIGLESPQSKVLGNYRHGHARGSGDTTTYNCWSLMKGRCRNPNHHKYAIYGGRGIKVCERWLSFINFLADMGEKPVGMTLERKDVNGNYTLENCEWATQKTQQNNKRNNRVLTFNGLTMNASQWSEHLGIPAGSIRCRLSKGWSIERVLSK